MLYIDRITYQLERVTSFIGSELIEDDVLNRLRNLEWIVEPCNGRKQFSFGQQGMGAVHYCLEWPDIDNPHLDCSGNVPTVFLGHPGHSHHGSVYGGIILLCFCLSKTPNV